MLTTSSAGNCRNMWRLSVLCDTVACKVARPLLQLVEDTDHDNLSPQKARILLMLALTVTNDPAELARIFATY